MTPVQKRILLVLSVAVALTRPLAVAHSLNDWDEALFSFAVGEYDVNQHHPHPPGYPLFIAAGKAIHALGLDEFRSLQIVVLLGAIFLFPALVLLAREIGFGFTTSLIGGAIFVFLPNVWIYGGTAFSDIPALTLGLTACALLFRGRTDRRAYVLGAAVLGLAAGFRVPMLLLGMVPALLATFHRLRARDPRTVILGMVIGGAITGGSYLGAALASGTLDQFRFMLSEQSAYVRKVDSWHNPTRPPLPEVAKLFFVWPVDQRRPMAAFAGLALAGLIGVAATRRWRLLFPLAMFGPLMVTSWLNLDLAAAGRYAIAYMAVHALYAAQALRWLGRKAWIACALGGAVVMVSAVWSWPALRQQRTSDAPAAGALLWVRRNVPSTMPVAVHGMLGPHADYLLPEHRVAFFEQSEDISGMTADVWVVEPQVKDGAMNFVWPQEELWRIIRRRNFEVALLQLGSYLKFGAGWYSQEGEGAQTFRWMGREARTELAPFGTKGRLAIRMFVPVHSIQPPPTVEVWMNDVLVERFADPPAILERAWILPTRASGVNELRITTSATVVPAQRGSSDDTRELGLRIDSISWTSAR